MIAAIIRVKAPSGALRTFVAERVERDHGLVEAVGYWRDDRARKRRAYTWSGRQIVEIRHSEVVA